MDTDQLLLEIARCPVVTAVRSGDARAVAHPCRKVVNDQAAVPLAQHQGPEPWTGHLASARILFVSSNPSISDRDFYPRWDEEDPALIPYFEDRFGGPGQITEGAH